MTAPGEAPAPREAAPETADQTRQRLDTLRTDVLESNSRETRELVGALTSLQGYMSTRSKASESTKQRILQEIQAVMTILSTMEDLEKTPPADLSSKLQPLLTRLNDAEQHLFALFPDEKNNSEEANGLITALDTAFDEKRQAIQRLGPLDTLSSFVSQSEALTSTEASAPAEAPEATPLSPEQQAFSDAVDADKKVSIKFAELLAKTHEDFITHMEDLKAEAPTTTNDVNQGLATFAASVLAIENGLREVDQLIKAGDTQTASTKLAALKTDLVSKLDGAIQQLTTSRDKKKLGLGLNDKEKAIVDQAIASLTEAKTKVDPLVTEREQSIAAVASKVEVLAQQKAPLPAVIFSPETQQAAGAVETRLSTLQQNVPALDNDPEHMTAEEFMDSIQNTWEEVNEAMQAKEWGAVLAGLVAMIAVIAGRLGSLDSIGDLVDFVGDYGKKKEGEEGAPEKPADIPQVLAQFGIENETKRDEFTDLKLSEVARFIEQDGVLPSGEPAYPQPLVDLKATQADAYGKLKAQLELNGFEAYHESLSDEDKSKKTLGDFIAHRFTSEATKAEGWKIA